MVHLRLAVHRSGSVGYQGKGGGRGKPADTTKFYKLLEVSKDASTSDIKKAYRKLAVKHHPDKGGDEATFKDITRAYEVLSDEDKRKRYDRHGEEGIDEGGGADAGDIFAQSCVQPCSASHLK